MSNVQTDAKVDDYKVDLGRYLQDIDNTIESLSKLRLMLLDMMDADNTDISSIDLEEPTESDDKSIDEMVDKSIYSSDILAKKIDMLIDKMEKSEKSDKQDKPDQSSEIIKFFQTSQSSILTGISEKIDSLIDKKNEESKQKCAPILGAIGEEDIVQSLNTDFPNMFVSHVSNIPHQCDIHIEDPASNILYMIEVKNKVSISKEDIIKFESDVDISPNKRTIGLFISINCDHIPGKVDPNNPFHIDMNKIYMIGYNKDILSLIFSIVSKFIFAKTDVDIDKDISLLCQRVRAIQETRQKRIVAINSNISSLKEVILNEETMKYEIEHELQLLSQCDAFISSNCGDGNSVNSAMIDERKSMIEYIKLNKNSFTKKTLIAKFPLQSAFIKSKTMSELKDMD